MFLPGDITLQPGDSGEYVSELQRRLAQRDLLIEANINGSYDGPTTIAVKSFQMMNGLKADGIAGPQTLRQLINLASADESGGGGGDASGEQEEEKELDSERFDEYEHAALRDQPDLENEALWVKGGQEKDAQELRQQEEKLTTKERIEERSRDQLAITQDGIEAKTLQHELNEQGVGEQHQKDMAQGQEQLKVDQKGVEAKTLQQDLDEKAIRAAEQKHDMPEKDAAATEMKEKGAQWEKVDLSTSAETRQADRKQLDPELARTDARLHPGTREQTQHEGQRLDSKGVKDAGLPPGAELGDLVPDNTPGMGKSREVGMGM